MTKLDKRVVLSFGGKGGTGKSTFMVSVAEWFDRQEIPHTLLDLDTENKNRGSLSHFFSGSAPKINIRTQAGLDAFVDYLDRGPAVILADMGAGSGQVTYDWFDTMHDCVRDLGIAFTGVGVVTDDPASVESLLTWASHLQDRVSYLVVQNAQSEVSTFTYWRQSREADQFRNAFAPATVSMDFRIAELENGCRNHGVSLGQVADRKTSAADLTKTSLILRAQAYRKRLFAELDQVREVLVP